MQLGLFVQKYHKPGYSRNISQLLGPICLLNLMPKQRLIGTEAETILSHSQGRQQKKSLPLPQCFLKLQANLPEAAFNKED